MADRVTDDPSDIGFTAVSRLAVVRMSFRRIGTSIQDRRGRITVFAYDTSSNPNTELGSKRASNEPLEEGLRMRATAKP